MAVRMRSVNVQCLAKPSAKQLKVPVAAKNLALGLASTAFLVQPARAAEADAVDATVSALTDVVKATGQAVKSGIDLVGAGVKVIKEGYDVASPYIQQGVEVVTPAVKEAVKVTSDVAAPVVSKAVPLVQDTLAGAIKSTGVDIDTVTKTTATVAKTATEGAAAAQPFLTQAVNFITTTEPVVLAEYGLGLLALYLASPAIGAALLGSFRGFAGEINAVQALEAINAEGNAVIVDIRSEKEKESSGIPDVPGGANKLIEVEFASIEDRKLRGSLRDASYIEAQVTALQVASLKRLSKGSKVILLDRNGGTSKTVAKELAKRGFSRVFVIEGGFDGRNGWVSSKLLVKPVAGSASFAPLPNVARTIATRRALPSPSK